MAASAFHVISTEVESYILKHNFLDTILLYVFINNPHWQSSGITIFLCIYYIVISDTLVGLFLDLLFFLACYNINLLRTSSQVTHLRNGPDKDTFFAMRAILCDDIMSERLEI